MNTSLKFEEIVRILEATIILDHCRNRGEIHTVVGSDLMSDILSFGERNAILLTGLINPQIIRTAEMVEIAAICFIRGKQPHTETVELARRNEITLLATNFSMFEACGRLYTSGLTDRDSHT